MNMDELRKTFERKIAIRDRIQSEIKSHRKEMRTNIKEERILEKAVELVKQVGLETQKQLEFHLAEQVSTCLAAVFDDPYELIVKFEEKRGTTEVLFMFSRDGIELIPTNSYGGSSGGGAIGVASFGLRIAYMLMRQNSKSQPVLILDEPFNRLKGEEANQRVLELVYKLSHELGIQIIMVSDERIPRTEIIKNADKVFFVNKLNGISQVKEV